MSFYQNTVTFQQWIQGYQNSQILKGFQDTLMTNSLLQTATATPKQPVTDLGNVQAAYGAAATIDNAFGSAQQNASNPLMQFTSMMPQLSAMNNFFGSSMSQANTLNNITASSIGLGGLLNMPSMPTPNFTGLGNAPIGTDTFMVGLGAAMGLIDPAALNSLGISAPTATTRQTGDAASVIKKLPVMSTSSMEKALNKTYTINGENVSFLTSDSTGKTMLNTSLDSKEAKAEFITNVSSKMDKEVRLAERRDYKNIAAEVLSEEILNAYIKKNGEPKNAFGSTKEQVLAGLKKIALKENMYVSGSNSNTASMVTLSSGSTSGLDPDIEAALKALPSVQQFYEGSNYGVTYAGYERFGMGVRVAGNPEDNASVKLFQALTADLSKEMKDKVINKNMSLGA